MARAQGRSVGTAGGSLNPGGWCANQETAEQGRLGEEATGRVLDSACLRGGAWVLHDVRIPGAEANIDHLVVSGRRLWLIDAKRWKPGFYWRVGRWHFRGLERFKPAEKATMEMARDRVARMLRAKVGDVEFLSASVVVWPSHDAPLALWAMRSMPGARLVSPSRFARQARWRCRRAPDMAIVEALQPFLN
jgi:hypothetical protein